MRKAGRRDPPNGRCRRSEEILRASLENLAPPLLRQSEELGGRSRPIQVIRKAGQRNAPNGRRRRTEYFQQSMEIDHRLCVVNPKDAQATRGLCVALSKLGGVTLDGWRRRGTEILQQTLEIAHRVAVDQKDAEADRNLFISYEKLGDVSLRMDDAAGRGNTSSKPWKSRAASPMLIRGMPGPPADFHFVSKVGQRDAPNGRHRRGAEILRTRIGNLPPPCHGRSERRRLRPPLSSSYEKLGDVTLRIGDAGGAQNTTSNSWKSPNISLKPIRRTRRRHATCPSRTKNWATRSSKWVTPAGRGNATSIPCKSPVDSPKPIPKTRRRPATFPLHTQG